MRKMLSMLLALALTATLAACGGGTSASSTAPSSSLPQSSESTPPQVSSVVVESEPEPEVDTTEETNALLQSGLWGYDNPNEMASFIAFHGDNEFFLYSARWYATEPYNAWGEYTIEGNIVTAISESHDSGTHGQIPSNTFVFEVTDGALVQQSGGNGLDDSLHTYTYQPYPPDVDYYGFSPYDWKFGTAEVGLRLRAEPNTDAEILREVDNAEVTVINVLGVSQTDPAWYYIRYGGVFGFAHGDYIAVQ